MSSLFRACVLAVFALTVDRPTDGQGDIPYRVRKHIPTEKSHRYDGGGCYANQFACASGDCIPLSGYCNFVDQCEDASDERGCSEYSGDVRRGRLLGQHCVAKGLCAWYDWGIVNIVSPRCFLVQSVFFCVFPEFWMGKSHFRERRKRGAQARCMRVCLLASENCFIR